MKLLVYLNSYTITTFCSLKIHPFAAELECKPASVGPNRAGHEPGYVISGDSCDCAEEKTISRQHLVMSRPFCGSTETARHV